MEPTIENLYGWNPYANIDGVATRPLPTAARGSYEIQKLSSEYKESVVEVEAAHRAILDDQAELSKRMARFLDSDGRVKQTPDEEVLFLKKGMDFRLQDLQSACNRLMLQERHLQGMIQTHVLRKTEEGQTDGFATRKLMEQVRAQQRLIETQKSELDELTFQKALLEDESLRLLRRCRPDVDSRGRQTNVIQPTFHNLTSTIKIPSKLKHAKPEPKMVTRAAEVTARLKTPLKTFTHIGEHRSPMVLPKPDVLLSPVEKPDKTERARIRAERARQKVEEERARQKVEEERVRQAEEKTSQVAQLSVIQPPSLPVVTPASPSPLSSKVQSSPGPGALAPLPVVEPPAMTASPAELTPTAASPAELTPTAASPAELTPTASPAEIPVVTASPAEIPVVTASPAEIPPTVSPPSTDLIEVPRIAPSPRRPLLPTPRPPERRQTVKRVSSSRRHLSDDAGVTKASSRNFLLK
ncbi:MAG: hypothetical protein KVP17_002710 [Porospora cf. gigantea B]|uniref:uncharacterized protein n=1 Tax=Porospora cf. gigantea B TaxID=2853592 RepID=UPI003571AD00|nr:MAG: hypothetical protein KVP17_002710 [Porospora cf. gigantea B]